MIRRKALIIDSSEIIRMGIGAILQGHLFQNEMFDSINFTLIQDYVKKESPDVLILNPALALDNSCEKIRLLRQEAINNNFKMMALVYAYFDQNVLSLFDEIVYINDDESKIMAKIKKLTDTLGKSEPAGESATLSQRELDVVRLVSLGHSNKEIAEELYISVHTVISHRKNITAKLGIKSASGLTIYAVINKLISPGDYKKSI